MNLIGNFPAAQLLEPGTPLTSAFDMVPHPFGKGAGHQNYISRACNNQATQNKMEVTN
jgi:hypothetical protein